MTGPSATSAVDVGVLCLISIVLIAIALAMVRGNGTSIAGAMSKADKLDDRLRAVETVVTEIRSEVLSLKDAQMRLTRTLDQFVAGSIDRFFEGSGRGHT